MSKMLIFSHSKCKNWLDVSESTDNCLIINLRVLAGKLKTHRKPIETVN